MTWTKLTRRAFVSCGAAALAPAPIIDAHIHLFDPTRPQGVPWPPKDNATLYRPALPPRYRDIAAPLGVVGAIKVEASPWIEDNQWVLDLAAKHPIIVGVVGNLDPGAPDFGRNLDRFHRNPLFRGIRYGTLWGRDLPAAITRPTVIDHLKALAAAGLSLDTATASPALLSALLRLTDQVPALRIVIDHLPQLEPPTEASALSAYESTVRELGSRPQVAVKVSEVLRRTSGRVPLDLDFYRSRLDQLWDTFGEDRLLFGSDWPNSDNWAPYPQVLAVVRDYFTAKGPTAAEKYFWRNSLRVYKWIHRDPSQPKA